MAAFEYNFPAIRGIQAGREYYASMCPLRLIPRIFLFDEAELNPELRAQRILNRSRVPEIARYILGNPKGYTFSALTASVDADVRFESLGKEQVERDIGRLRIPMNAKFVINDGQHRRAAIETALRENPELGDESISVVFFLDVGLERSQQMFSDLNRHAIRPTSSLSLLYDHRDDMALLVKTLLQRVSVFQDLTELEKSSISNRSLKLFTLSGIYNATQTLLAGLEEEDEEKLSLAIDFWNEVAKQIPEWLLAKQKNATPAELRRDYVHAHTLALAALGRVGNAILRSRSSDWKNRIRSLKSLDWRRSNTKLWEGRAMNAGRLSKKSVNIVLVGNAIKKHVKIALDPTELELERAFERAKHEASATPE